MTLEEIKTQWNKGIDRINKAEKVANDNPQLFEKYIAEFNKICREMSCLMAEYKNITGEDISAYEFENGFDK